MLSTENVLCDHFLKNYIFYGFWTVPGSASRRISGHAQGTRCVAGDRTPASALLLPAHLDANLKGKYLQEESLNALSGGRLAQITKMSDAPLQQASEISNWWGSR